MKLPSRAVGASPETGPAPALPADAAAAATLKAFVDGLPDPVLVKDRRFRWVLANQAMADLLGRAPEDLVGLTDFDVAEPEAARLSRAADEAAFAAETGHEVEREVPLLSGVRALARIRRRVVRLAPDAEPLLVVSAIDAAPVRRAERELKESLEHYRDTVELSPQIPWTADPDGAITHISSRWTALVGMSQEEALGAGWTRAVRPDDLPQVLLAWAEAVRTGEPLAAEYRVRAASGEERWVRAWAAPRHNAQGEVVRWYGALEDIDERKRAEAEADAAARRLHAVLESTSDGVVVANRDGRVSHFNRNAERLFGHPLALGAQLSEVIPRALWGGLGRAAARAARKSSALTVEGYSEALDRWLEVRAHPTEEGLAIFLRDVSEQRRAEQQRRAADQRMLHLARHDPLTNLPNRLVLMEDLKTALADRRSGSRSAVFYLDLDGFKEVNDSLGHAAGDTVLSMVALRLRTTVRASDTLARLGGDEFAILQRRLEGPENAAGLAERLIRALSEPFDVDGRQVVIGVSIGVALTPHDGDTPEALLKAADTALYRAKSAGRGAFRFYEPGMTEDILKRQAMKIALMGALAGHQFELHYQPLADLRSARVSGFEALLRWNHPTRGLVSPADFVPLAEEIGSIEQIGEWVLTEACRAAVKWPEPIEVAVNLSPVQLRSGAVVGAVQRALAQSGLHPRRLQLEITESVLLQDSEINLKALNAIRGLGARVVLDDFGTGYSSLSYLQSFKFDKIKLDRSFVRRLDTAEAKAIVSAVSGLAAGLGLTVTAEGIETAEQVKALIRRGFHEGQGFYFSRPKPEADAAQLAKAGVILHLDDAGPPPPDGRTGRGSAAAAPAG